MEDEDDDGYGVCTIAVAWAWGFQCFGTRDWREREGETEGRRLKGSGRLRLGSLRWIEFGACRRAADQGTEAKESECHALGIKMNVPMEP